METDVIALQETFLADFELSNGKRQGCRVIGVDATSADALDLIVLVTKADGTTYAQRVDYVTKNRV